MKRHALNFGLAFVLVLLAVITWGLKRDVGQPGYQFIPEMVYAIPFEPQSENPVFRDGKTLQPPVSGTISRGMVPLHYERTDEDAKRAGRELKNPLSKDSSRIAERGSRLYAAFCQPCHGVSGSGDGVVTRYGFPPPPAFSSPAVAGQRDGQMFHTITYGKGNMPSLASQVSREDRWMIVLHVRRLQQLVVEQERKERQQGAP